MEIYLHSLIFLIWCLIKHGDTFTFYDICILWNSCLNYIIMLLKKHRLCIVKWDGRWLSGEEINWKENLFQATNVAFCGNMEENSWKLRSVSNKIHLECTTPTCLAMCSNYHKYLLWTVPFFRAFWSCSFYSVCAIAVVISDRLWTGWLRFVSGKDISLLHQLRLALGPISGYCGLFPGSGVAGVKKANGSFQHTARM